MLFTYLFGTINSLDSLARWEHKKSGKEDVHVHRMYINSADSLPPSMEHENDKQGAKPLAEVRQESVVFCASFGPSHLPYMFVRSLSSPDER